MTIAIIILSILLVVIILVAVLKKSISKEDYNDPFLSESCNIKMKDKYLNDSEYYFFRFVSSHLEENFYILPKVGVDNLVEPQNYDLRQYNAIKAKYVDFVIFDSVTQKPVVAIDLVERSVSSKNPYFDKDISASLKMINLPIWTKYVEKFYVWPELKVEIEKYTKTKEQDSVEKSNANTENKDEIKN